MGEDPTRSVGNNLANDEKTFQPSATFGENVNKYSIKAKIQKFREERKKNKVKFQNLITVKRSNNVFEALNLPAVLNLNPRSIYNKVNEFVTFVDEEEIDLVCMSESWEREYLTLEKVIKIEYFEVISKVFQRKGKGGRPAIIVNSKKYHIENLTQSVISIPWGVEVVWAVMTPKHSNNSSKIQKIVIGSIYCKPDSRKKNTVF